MDERVSQAVLSLHKLELQGFKSFSDRTDLVFSPGITAIVGPNGCGKSNISDSIAWVLGEQSAKSLRGERMEDIIFSGTEGSNARAPLGMAQVNLTLKSQLTEYKEIVVSRRLFRDDESQYFMDGAPCRLRDIQDFIFGTGMGARSYFLIQQGRIGQILESKPTDRRMLIEEAAGISKYRAKKHAAELKLEAARQNLERIRDVIAEVRKQMNSLKRQAYLARRYQRLAEAVRRLHKLLLSIRFRDLASEMEVAEEVYSKSREHEVALAAALASSELAIERLDLQVIESERDFETMKESVYDLRLKIGRGEADVARSRADRENLHVLIEQNRRRTEGLAERDARLQSRQSVCENDLRTIEDEVSAVEEALRAAAAAFRETEESSQRLAEAARLLRIQQRESSGKSAALQNDLISITSERSRLEGAVNRLRQEKERSAARATELDLQITQIREAIESAAQELFRIGSAVRERVEQEAAEVERLNALETELAEIEQRRTASASRLQAIQAIEKGHTLAPPSVRTILNDYADRIRTPGTFADFIEVTDVSLVWAVENCLKAVLNGLVMDSTQDALSAMEAIQDVGPVTYLSAELLGAGVEPIGALPCRPLAEFVRIDARYPFLAALLAHVYVTETIEDAIRRRSDLAWAGSRAVFASRKDGSCLLPSGAILAGSAGHNEESILWIKAEARRLQAEVADLTQQGEPLAVEAARVREGLLTIRADLDTQRSLLAEHEKSHLLESQRASQFESERRNIAEHLQTISTEIDQLAQDVSAAIERQQILQRDATSVDGELQGIAFEIEGSDREIAADQERRAASRDAVTRQEGVRATLFERRRQLTGELDRLRIEIRDVRDEQESCVSDMQAKGLQIQEIDARRLRLEEQIVFQIRDLQEKEARLREKEQVLQSVREESAGQHEQVKAMRTEHQESMEARSKAELVRAEKGRDLAHLRQTCIEEFSQTAEEIAAEVQAAAATEEEAVPPTEEASDAEPASVQSPSLADPAGIAEELAKKKTELEKMGAINLRAREDYDEASQRHEFLTSQEKDVLQSIESTVEAIRKMDEESRILFMEAFTRINANFGEVFRVLFEGGNADMKLMEGEDILECGIEITAQPPGKKPLSLRLRSGGEQALTAIALLFAIFQYKPSPFCLLDEVDAPLDETNIDRFLRLLQAYSARIQFILITHNVKTMQAASTLYGITMQEPGVSSVVSVRLSEASTTAA